MKIIIVTVAATCTNADGCSVSATAKTVAVLALSEDEAINFTLRIMESQFGPGWVFGLPSVVVVPDAMVETAYQCIEAIPCKSTPTSGRVPPVSSACLPSAAG